jgi:DNA-directed RNA polymerase subunit RPC12/RpoP
MYILAMNPQATDLKTLTDDEVNQLYANVYAEKIRREMLRNPAALVYAPAPAPTGMTAKKEKKPAKLKPANPNAPSVATVCVDCGAGFNTKQGCTRCQACARRAPKVKCPTCSKLFTDWGIASREGKCPNCSGAYVKNE